MNKVVIYARSSWNEADLQKRLELLRQSLAPEDRLLATYHDLSPGTGYQRPGLEELLGHLEIDDVQALYVLARDRLARNGKELAMFERLLRERRVVLREVQNSQSG